ncbi:major facilitator superfamily domain-containing protein [Aspergillus floccosus]
METSRNTTPPPHDKESTQAGAVKEAQEVATTSVHSVNESDENLPALDKQQERRLRWKVDLYVIPTVTVLYLFCFIDRANIGNARLAGLEKDLGLTGYDYNILLSIFYVSYIVFEIPSSLTCKWMGPGWFIPLTSLGFGICSIGTAFVHNLGQACAVRFVLGIFEAGMMPGIAYYMSRWYTKSELTFRVSYYVVMGSVGGAVGGLLASGIFKLDHVGSLRDWRMLFAVEGIITCGLAVIGFFTLTDRPETARWLTEEEKAIVVARVQAERIGATELLEKMNKKKILRGIINPVTIPTAFIFLLLNITVQGLAFFLPTVIKTIYPTHTVVFQQLYTVPPYAVGSVFMMTIAYLSSRTDRRLYFFMISALLVIIGYIMFLATGNQQARYGATFLVASGAFIFGALTNSHVSANVVSDTARSAAIGTNVMLGNIGGLIATWSFLPFDGPSYPIGNGLNLATSSTILITSVFLFLWMRRDNRKRDGKDADAELARIPSEKIADLDWKHPSFRWKD